MTAKEVSNLSGVSVRTLHHYDQIGLLMPARDNLNNYRIYDDDSLDQLQQILFFKECGFSLSKIQELMQDRNYNKEILFLLQKELLLKEKERIEEMILTLDNSIKTIKGELNMTNSEKFEALKKQKLNENEEKFGKEIREKYGEAVVEKSNRNYQNMPKKALDKLTTLDKSILSLLSQLILAPEDAETQKSIALMHKQWVQLSWQDAVEYSKEAHLNLCDMYIADERFQRHYGGLKEVMLLKSAIEKFL